MRTVRPTIRDRAIRNQPRCLLAAQSITRLDRSLAGHHVEYICKRRFLSMTDLPRLHSAGERFVRENLGHEDGRIHVALQQKHREGVNGDRPRSGRVRLYAEPLKERRE